MHTRPSSTTAALAALIALTWTSIPTQANRALGGSPNSHERTVAVAGTGVDQLKTALVHSKETTATGMIQRSTEIVDLDGDLKGRVLYHVTSVFDFVHNTLVNTGDQVYSGTIKGSEPVMLHDDQFHFDVNLSTGAEQGEVFLFNHIAGPKVRCKLDVTGTGLTPEGNPTFEYHGECRFRSQ
jgi:hypothetical protein